MRKLPFVAQIYILTVFGLGILGASPSVPALVFDRGLLLPAIGLSALIAYLDSKPIEFHGHNSVILPSSAVKIAAVLLFPSSVVLFSVFSGTLISELCLKRAWYRAIFNTGALTITYLAVLVAYGILHQPGVGILGSPANLAAVILLGLTDVAVNTLVVSLIVALSQKQSVVNIWTENFKPVVLHDLSMVPIGVFIAMLWLATPVSIVLVIAPLLLARKAYQVVVDLETQTREALMAMARVLDERDQETSHHCEGVARYATTIGRQLGLPPSEIDVISRAAWLHDIGKVGMRNDILFKPGQLTREEREEAQRHAVIGGDLLTKFPLFEKGAVYVRHHHERWDGTGYPDKLTAEQIPLGARILAVADSFQAMTAERPYRKPLSEEAALEQLRRGAGTQFDPKVVEAFFRSKGFTYYSPRPDPLMIVADHAGSAAE